jgi:glutaredoxin
MTDTRQDLILYRRPACELCDEARAIVQIVLEERARLGETIPTFREVDITGDTILEERFGASIPVIAVDGRHLDLATGGKRVRSFLDRTLGRLA